MGSGLNCIFHWNAYSLAMDGSLLRSLWNLSLSNLSLSNTLSNSYLVWKLIGIWWKDCCYENGRKENKMKAFQTPLQIFLRDCCSFSLNTLPLLYEQELCWPFSMYQSIFRQKKYLGLVKIQKFRQEGVWWNPRTIKSCKLRCDQTHELLLDLTT